MKMVFKNSYIFPIILGCWLPLTVFITYTVSVLTDHVTPVLPYISDTGSWAPESCIFGIMLTCGAFIWIAIIYIRYRQVEEIQEKNELSILLRRINIWSLYSGIISVFGVLIVANFQVRLIFFVHIIGACICFGFATLYQIIQVIISFKVYPFIGKKIVNISRIIFTLLSTLSLVVTFLCATVAFTKFEGSDMTKWKPEDGGYDFHFVSAIGEYVLTISTVLNIVSLTEEFKFIEINEPKINTKLDQK